MKAPNACKVLGLTFALLACSGCSKDKKMDVENFELGSWEYAGQAEQNLTPETPHAPLFICDVNNAGLAQKLIKDKMHLKLSAKDLNLFSEEDIKNLHVSTLSNIYLVKINFSKVGNLSVKVYPRNRCMISAVVVNSLNDQIYKGYALIGLPDQVEIEKYYLRIGLNCH